MRYRHIPVLLKEVIEYLDCLPNKIYVDCTVGEGGHAEEILNKTSPEGRLIGIDRDADALKVAEERLRRFANRFVLINDDFVNISEILKEQGIERVDGIFFDLGVSSLQLEDAGRGFSFLVDAPLDMRMDRREGIKASDLVNTLSEEELRELIWKYGEERWARRIAAAIVRERRKKPIERTSQLVEVITRAVPAPYRYRRIHPATRTFQALRIAVNRELDVLPRALQEASGYLNVGGRLCVISFHSLEDRIVKNILKSLPLRVLTKKPVTPSGEEIAINPRARSAKLRAAEHGGEG